ncbi:elongator complex protein 5 [Malaya genurostris]|uniref:elongator complex protein 5 n=1 Tax=Malaya genurostris TaxID=325434 RepID=UPI0026F3EE4A|nr:elongator complex protein 5 [Malaya genurostris]
MLSAYLLNQQKIVLIKDHFGIENTSCKIVNGWLHEQKGSSAVLNMIESLNENGAFLYVRISKLARTHDPPELFRFVNACKRNNSVKYLFLWATEKNIRPGFLVPYLEHMAGLILTIVDDKHLSILTKKQGGSVSNKFYQYQILGGSFSVKESKKPDRTKTIDGDQPASIDPASLGTFKIGDLKKEEQEAKDSLMLPFEFYKTTSEGGKVLYHPDAGDDLDEEDPDDDLLI